MTDLTEIIANWRENGTPGPWEMSRENHLDGTAEVVFSNHARDKMSKEWLSDAWFAFARAWVRQRGSDVDYPTGKANAALIAAAPDMADRIERLEAALKRVDYWLDTDEEILAAMPDDERASHERLHRMVLAALDGESADD